MTPRPLLFAALLAMAGKGSFDVGDDYEPSKCPVCKIGDVPQYKKVCSEKCWKVINPRKGGKRART